MGFGADAKGVAAFSHFGSLLGDLGTSYIGSWVGDLVSLGAAISAFGCCLACMVGASRLLFAMNRDELSKRRHRPRVLARRRGGADRDDDLLGKCPPCLPAGRLTDVRGRPLVDQQHK